MPQKLTESSTAVVLLRKKLAAGEVSLTDNPKTVWSSDPLFMEHKLDNFRSKFNRIRTEEPEKTGKENHILFFYSILFLTKQFSISNTPIRRLQFVNSLYC